MTDDGNGASQPFRVVVQQVSSYAVVCTTCGVVTHRNDRFAAMKEAQNHREDAHANAPSQPDANDEGRP